MLLLRVSCQSDCRSLLQGLSLKEKEILMKPVGKERKKSNVYLAIPVQTTHQGKQIRDMGVSPHRSIPGNK